MTAIEDARAALAEWDSTSPAYQDGLGPNVADALRALIAEHECTVARELAQMRRAEAAEAELDSMTRLWRRQVDAEIEHTEELIEDRLEVQRELARLTTPPTADERGASEVRREFPEPVYLPIPAHLAKREARHDAAVNDREALSVDDLAKVLCRIEGRSQGRSLDEVVAPGVELWMRYRYEAERLIEELRPLLAAGFRRQGPITDERAITIRNELLKQGAPFIPLGFVRAALEAAERAR